MRARSSRTQRRDSQTRAIQVISALVARRAGRGPRHHRARAERVRGTAHQVLRRRRRDRFRHATTARGQAFDDVILSKRRAVAEGDAYPTRAERALALVADDPAVSKLVTRLREPLGAHEVAHLERDSFSTRTFDRRTGDVIECE
jgi:hypothetical protein